MRQPAGSSPTRSDDPRIVRASYRKLDGWPSLHPPGAPQPSGRGIADDLDPAAGQEPERVAVGGGADRDQVDEQGSDGELIAVSWADRLLNPKLRRAQALAADSELGLQAVRELVVAKLRRQLTVLAELQERFRDLRIASQASPIIERGAEEIARVGSLREIRGREAVAGR
jgi:hypothetical protein